MHGKRPAPLSHRDRRNLQLGRDLLVVRPVGRRQDNAGMHELVQSATRLGRTPPEGDVRESS